MSDNIDDLDATLVDPRRIAEHGEPEKTYYYPSLEARDDSPPLTDGDVDELQEDVKPTIVSLLELSDSDDENKEDKDEDPPAPLSSIDTLFSRPVDISPSSHHENPGSPAKLSVEVTVKQTLPTGEVVQLARYTNSDGESRSFTSHTMSHAFDTLRGRAMEMHRNHEKTYRAWETAREELRWLKSLNEIYRNSEKAKEKAMEESSEERDKALEENRIAVKEKEEAVEKMENAIVQRDKARKETEQAIKEAQDAVAAKKKVEEERVQRFIQHAEETSRRSAEHDKLREDKDKAVESLDQVRKELEEERKKRQSIFETHSQWSVDWTAGEKRKAQELQEKDRLIEEKDREIKRLKMDRGLDEGSVAITETEVLVSMNIATGELIEKAMEAMEAADAVPDRPLPDSDEEADESIGCVPNEAFVNSDQECAGLQNQQAVDVVRLAG